MLSAAVKTNDYDGYKEQVWGPLIKMMSNFPDDATLRGNHLDCYLALSTLSNIGDDFTEKSGVKRSYRLENDLPQYKEYMANCKASID